MNFVFHNFWAIHVNIKFSWARPNHLQKMLIIKQTTNFMY